MHPKQLNLLHSFRSTLWSIEEDEQVLMSVCLSASVDPRVVLGEVLNMYFVARTLSRPVQIHRARREFCSRD